MTTGEGLFGATKDDVGFTIDATNMRIETINGTGRYARSAVSKMIISEIANPVHIGTFGSFRIVIMDEYKDVIAD